MGVCNIASSLIGGLTIIPGGVKSKANIASGGRTLWANFTNAICLVIYLAIGASLINMIPKGVLAAVLIFTGWKMCEPAVWKHMAKIGKEQLALFTFTVLVTLLTDLLIGIIAGVVAKYFLNLLLCRHAVAMSDDESATLGRYMLDFFRHPVKEQRLENGELHLIVNKPLVCFNSMKLELALSDLPTDVKSVNVHIDSRVALIDHTSCETLRHAVESFAHNGITVNLIGLDRMLRLSKHSSSVHVGGPSTSPQVA
jgi:MFS superfamily sulfate permease-like transporter